jgi:protein phosphatase methylesterase 1
MSNLQRSAMSARLAKLPGYIPDVYTPTVAPGFATEDESAEELEEAMSSLGQLLSMAPPNIRKYVLIILEWCWRLIRAYRSGGRPLRSAEPPDLSDYAPISASNHFTQAISISVDAVGYDFRVYYTPPVTKANELGAVLVCHHGAGYSGLTFACLAQEVTELSKGELGVLTFDARRHGESL